MVADTSARASEAWSFTAEVRAARESYQPNPFLNQTVESDTMFYKNIQNSPKWMAVKLSKWGNKSVFLILNCGNCIQKLGKTKKSIEEEEKKWW